MSSTDFPIPEGYYPPFAIISEDDHTGWIIIATALGLTLVLISSIIRFVLRSTLGQKAGTDDILLGVATVSQDVRTQESDAPSDMARSCSPSLPKALYSARHPRDSARRLTCSMFRHYNLWRV